MKGIACKMTKNKSYTILLIFLIFLSISIKFICYHYADITPIIDRYVYKTKIQKFNKKDINDIKLQLNNSEISYFYIGRVSCKDCRASIKNILYLMHSLPCDNIFYVEMPEILTKTEKDFISNRLKIENIPVIIAVNQNGIQYFQYENINSKNNRQELLFFIEKSKEELN